MKNQPIQQQIIPSLSIHSNHQSMAQIIQDHQPQSHLPHQQQQDQSNEDRHKSKGKKMLQGNVEGREIEERKNTESQSEQKGKKIEQIKRVKQNIVFFILTVLFSLNTGTQNLYMFLSTLENRDIYITFPTIIMRTIFYPIATFSLCQNWKVLFRLFFMIDKILLALLLSCIGVMGFILIFLQFTLSPWFYESLFIFYPLVMFLYAGNFRVMMVYCEWSKCEVLIFKSTLLVGSTSFFILGMYYLVQSLKFTEGQSKKVDEIITNLLLIYINAGFQFYLEMFSRMDSVDGTSGFMNNYKLHCHPQDMEALLNGRRSSDDEEQIESQIINRENKSENRKGEARKNKFDQIQIQSIP